MRNPVKITRKMCKHVGVEFREDVYSSIYFEKKLKADLIYSYKKLSLKNIKRVEKSFKNHCIDI